MIMPDIYLTIGHSGQIFPSTEKDSEYFAKKKYGTVLKAKISEMRNGRFFRKWWCLAKFAFDHWEFNDYEWKGQKIQPNFERFRKDLVILAGHADPVWNIKSELRMEARSISWARMSEEEFEDLYSKTITVILQSTYFSQSSYSEAELRQVIDQLMGFM